MHDSLLAVQHQQRYPQQVLCATGWLQQESPGVGTAAGRLG
ncbi:hypothetical protein [Hymenobacter sp. HSC-4F20]|nr:hypothetical protein [Hymenobacter sp. HSC-4F20]